MSRPQVLWLEYRVETDNGLLIAEGAPPIEMDHEAFYGRATPLYFVAYMKVSVRTGPEAREIVEPVLRAWELDEALRRGYEVLRFSLTDCSTIDLDPDPPAAMKVFEVTAVERAVGSDSWSASLETPVIPPPPVAFSATEDVEILWTRYRRCVEGGESTQTMAYFCVSWIEDRLGGRPPAASRLRVTRDLLDEVRNLAHRGDPLTARKAAGSRIPLSAEREQWLRETVRELIRRMGVAAAGGELPRLGRDWRD